MLIYCSSQEESPLEGRESYSSLELSYVLGRTCCNMWGEGMGVGGKG